MKRVLCLIVALAAFNFAHAQVALETPYAVGADISWLQWQEDSGVKFSDRTFAEQVDDVLSGEDTMSTHLKIADHTPEILIELGLNNKPLLITSAHTKTAVGKK